jgi:hypothetical protein
MATRTPARNGKKPARRPVRKPARRKSRAPYRGLIFGPAVPGGLAPWLELGQPGHAIGALASLALGLALVPVLMLALITAPGTLLHAMVPKDWRKAWRRGRKHPGPPKALLQRMVRAADRNRCVGCGVTAAEVKALAQSAAVMRGSRRVSQSTLQLDHFFPWSLGGLMNFWNFFLLCPHCNMVKSNYWEWGKSGRVTYRPFEGADHAETARLILARERQARWSLARCWRAAWAL